MDPLQQMYAPKKDSPSTYLTGDIGIADTYLYVGSADLITQAVPFPLTLGYDRSVTETVMVTNITNNQLTVIRSSTPLNWGSGTKCARVFTSDDLLAVQNNIKTLSNGLDELDTSKLESTGDTSNTTNTFTQASIRENLVSGEKTSLSFGKIMKMFADFGTSAWATISGAASDYKMNGSAAPGTTGKVADAGHIHPIDTTRADDTKVLHLMGNETIDGIKTFVKSPTGPIPSQANDFVIKSYLDARLEGKDTKDECEVATTTNITLSGLQTIDGVILFAGDRVLVKNQTDASQNGIYDAASGTWQRSYDANADAEVTSGLTTYIQKGTINGLTGWYLATSNPISLGNTSLQFNQNYGVGTYVNGSGIQLTGNRFSADYADKPTAEAGIDTIKLMSPIMTLASIVKNAVIGTLTGYTKSGTGALAPTDTINQAFGKIEVNLGLKLTSTDMPLSLPTTAWVSDSTYSGYGYRATISDVSILATDRVNVFLDVPSVDLAVAAGVSSRNDNVSGSCYLFSKNKPAATLTGTYSIVKGGQ